MAETQPYRVFTVRHPEYEGEYLEFLEALDAGGRKLLKCKKHLDNALRKTLSEQDEVWAERSARAVYPNYLGGINGFFVATVFGDSLTIKLQDPSGEEPSDAPPDWRDWLDNAAMVGAKPVTVPQHMRKVLRTLLTKKVAYTLVELPKAPDADAAPATRLQQEALGLGRPYLIPVDPVAVVDWEDDDAGELVWVLIKSVECKRRGIGGDRTTITETYREITPTEWKVWQITYTKKDRPDGPRPEDLVTVTDSGAHTFGRVNLVRHRGEEGMWTADLMCSAQCDIFRARSGYAWLRDKVNVPAPYLKLQNLTDGANTVMSDDIVKQQGRGKVESGVGGITYLAQNDDLGFASPDAAALTVNLSLYEKGIEELYMTMHQMAQGIRNTGAAVGRSGESKAIDSSSTSVISKALGATVRTETLQILRMAEAGRGEAKPINWAIGGCDEIEMATAADAINDLVALESVTVPPEFRVEMILRTVRLLFPDQPALWKRVGESAKTQMTGDQAAVDAEAKARTAAAEAAAKNPGGAQQDSQGKAA